MTTLADSVLPPREAIQRILEGLGIRPDLCAAIARQLGGRRVFHPEIPRQAFSLAIAAEGPEDRAVFMALYPAIMQAIAAEAVPERI